MLPLLTFLPHKVLCPRPRQKHAFPTNPRAALARATLDHLQVSFYSSRSQIQSPGLILSSLSENLVQSPVPLTSSPTGHTDFLFQPFFPKPILAFQSLSLGSNWPTVQVTETGKQSEELHYSLLYLKPNSLVSSSSLQQNPSGGSSFSLCPHHLWIPHTLCLLNPHFSTFCLFQSPTSAGSPS